MKKRMLVGLMLFLSYGGMTQSFLPWVAVFGNDNLIKKFNFHYELQYRSHGSLNQLDQVFARTGVGYSFSDDTQNILLGYGYFYQKDEYCFSSEILEDERDQFKQHEHRLFQQFIMKHELSRLLINHRYRFEQRFMQEDFRLRFRYFLSVYLPLNNTKIEQGTIFLGTYNEFFMYTNGTFFDRNRSYLSMGYAVTDYLKLEVGLMRQTTIGERINIFQISIFNNLDFKIHH
jgi:hypothetical protein